MTNKKIAKILSKQIRRKRHQKITEIVDNWKETKMTKESSNSEFKVGDLVHHRTYCPLTSEPIVWKKVLRIREVYLDRHTGSPVYIAGDREFDSFELIEVN